MQHIEHRVGLTIVDLICNILHVGIAPSDQARPEREEVPMNATSPRVARPTVVLVHGAFAESASWNGVIADLQRRGYTVIAVANPLRGLQQDAAYLRSVLDSLSGPVVVAGHSYGGSVMSEAADGAPGVTALVYIASFNLEVGESTGGAGRQVPGRRARPRARPRAVPARRRRDRHGPVHPAGPVPRGVRRRRRAGGRRADGGHAATDRRLRAGGQRHQGGLEDDPVLDPGDHPGPGHPGRVHALHGRARRLDDRRDRRLPRRHRVPARRRRRPHRRRRPRHRRRRPRRRRRRRG